MNKGMNSCKHCHGSGSISYPITHPTNPVLDSWGSYTCDCVPKRLAALEALEATRPETADYRAGYDAGFKAGLLMRGEL